MYALTGKLTAQDGKRNALVEILLRAAIVVGQLPECHAYIVNEDIADEACVWVFEIWDSKEGHDASLKDDRVRSLIAEAMPFMGAAPGGSELRVMGGYGVSD